MGTTRANSTNPPLAVPGSQRRPSGDRSTGITALVFAVVVLIAVVLGVLVSSVSPGQAAAPGPAGATVAGEPTGSVSWSAPSDLPLPDLMSAAPVAVFIGDSYTRGTGATDLEHRWSTLVAADRGWSEVNLGFGGVGYFSSSTAPRCDGSPCPSYPSVLPLASGSAPDVLVIAGGQNDFEDWDDDKAAVRTAIAETFGELRELFPATPVVVVGPSTPIGVTPTVRQYAAAVAVAADEAGAVYIDLLTPNVVDSEMLVEDRGHVDDAGHAAIAERVIAGLDRAGSVLPG